MSVELRRITLTENPDGWWTAYDEEAEAVSQGPTREEALENLDEAVKLVEDEDYGREPTEEELREWGIDLDEYGDGGDLPEVLK
jgi:predicted RNase H-like HicB family nuclease